MIELLISEDKQSYFINCARTGEFLTVGACYIAPNSSASMVLLDEEGAKFSVNLPLDTCNQPVEMVATRTTFLLD